MRHRKASLKLNRTTSHRKAMFRNMVTSLFKHERIRTTGPKAKELRRWADHLITLAKRGDLHARRQALSIVREKAVVHKLFDEANEKFGHSAGGYTRIVKLGRRAGDAAPMSLIELVVPEPESKKKSKKKSAKKGAAKSKPAARKKTAAEAKAPKKAPAKKASKTAAGKKTEPKSEAKDKLKEEKPEAKDAAAKKTKATAAKAKPAGAEKSDKSSDDEAGGDNRK